MENCCHIEVSGTHSEFGMPCARIAEVEIVDLADQRDTAQTFSCYVHIGQMLGHAEGIQEEGQGWRVTPLNWHGKPKVREIVRDRVQLFLYYLMRDHLPIGQVASIIRVVNQKHPSDIQYTSQEMEDLAKRYANEVRRGSGA